MKRITGNRLRAIRFLVLLALVSVLAQPAHADLTTTVVSGTYVGKFQREVSDQDCGGTEPHKGVVELYSDFMFNNATGLFAYGSVAGLEEMVGEPEMMLDHLESHSHHTASGGIAGYFIMNCVKVQSEGLNGGPGGGALWAASDSWWCIDSMATWFSIWASNTTNGTAQGNCQVAQAPDSVLQLSFDFQTLLIPTNTLTDPQMIAAGYYEGIVIIQLVGKRLT